MIEYLLIAVLGVLAGSFTGLIPGIHPNTVIFMILPFYLEYSPDFYLFSSFVLGMSVSHTFLNFLPAILLGIPEAENALSSLPGSRLALEGRALEAFHATVYGGAYSLFFTALILPIVFLVIDTSYGVLEKLIPYLLTAGFVFLTLRGTPVVPRVLTVLSAGFLGFMVFGSSLNQNYVLVPVFAGLFAVPQIIRAVTREIDIPEQDRFYSRRNLDWKGGAAGSVSGLIAGLLPGLGPAASSLFLSPWINSKKKFLASMGGVNTADILVSFLAVFLIGNPRSGAAVALNSVKELSRSEILFASAIGVFCAGITIPWAVAVAPHYTDFFTRLPVRKLMIGILLFLIAVTVFLVGLPGVLVLFASSAIGFSATIYETRILTMAVLVVPVITYLV